MVYFKNILFLFILFFGQMLLGASSQGTRSSNKKTTREWSPRYKTKLCENWKKNGDCDYGKRCCFAHGEVNSVTDNVNYKRSPCRNELSPNGCPFKDKCFYQHVSRGEISYSSLLDWLIETTKKGKNTSIKPVLKVLCSSCERFPKELLKMDLQKLEETYKNVKINPSLDYTLKERPNTPKYSNELERRSPTGVISGLLLLSEPKKAQVDLEYLEERKRVLDEQIFNMKNDPFLLCAIRSLKSGNSNQDIEAIIDGYRERLDSLHKARMALNI